MKKNVDDHGSTQKNRKKKKSRAKNGLLKKGECFCQIKRQIVLLFYPSCLNQGMKGWQYSNVLVGILRLVN